MKLKQAVIAAAFVLGGVGTSSVAMAKQQSSQGQQQQQQEISGSVLGTKEKDIFIRGQDGAAVPIRVTHQTMIDGQRLKKDERIESHLKKEFKQGDQVSANIQVKTERGEAENLAMSVSKK